MSTAEAPRLDPITFEVLRHKLDEIVAEAYHTIGRVSGSPVVYEAGDHQEAICTATGDLAAFGAGVLHWVRSISEGVRHVSTELAENPGSPTATSSSSTIPTSPPSTRRTSSCSRRSSGRAG
jgi:N-methylhydantoinase B